MNEVHDMTDEAWEQSLLRAEDRNRKRAIARAEANDALGEWADQIAERVLGEEFDSEPSLLSEYLDDEAWKKILGRHVAGMIGLQVLRYWGAARRQYINHNRNRHTDREWVEKWG